MVTPSLADIDDINDSDGNNNCKLGKNGPPLHLFYDVVCRWYYDM